MISRHPSPEGRIHDSDETGIHLAFKAVRAAICGDGSYVPDGYEHMPFHAAQFEADGLIDAGMSPEDVMTGMQRAFDAYYRSTGVTLKTPQPVGVS